jgi:hypothetical protein
VAPSRPGEEESNIATSRSPLAPIYECPNPACRATPLFVNEDESQTCQACGASTLRPLGDGSFTDRYGRVVKERPH